MGLSDPVSTFLSKTQILDLYCSGGYRQEKNLQTGEMGRCSSFLLGVFGMERKVREKVIKISLEHICGECRESLKTAGRLYTHLRDHGYSIERAHSQYLLALAIERMAMEARWQSEKSAILKSASGN